LSLPAGSRTSISINNDSHEDIDSFPFGFCGICVPIQQSATHQSHKAFCSTEIACHATSNVFWWQDCCCTSQDWREGQCRAPCACSIYNLFENSNLTNLLVPPRRDVLFPLQVVVSQGNKVIKEIESPEATNLRKLLLANNVEVKSVSKILEV
jgi:hypothetical protein